MKALARLLGALLLLVSGQNSVQAQGFGLSEVRAGVMAHSVDEAPGVNLTFVEDLNFEALFASPELDAVWRFGSLRPHVGATLNFGGKESMVYAGLTWQVPIAETPFFFEAGFGGAIHNGDATGAIAPRRNLGCNVLFHEQASLGAHLGQQATVMLTVEHASHAMMCGPENRGLTNLGVRFGYKF